MIGEVSFVISLLAFCLSVLTAWLTLFRRGTVEMTQPTVIFFGPDSPRHREELLLPKVYLRALLFGTSKRGRVIENMHVTLSRNETQQNFNIWVYGDEKLVRGSGLFVGETGVAVSHHFLSPRDNNSFQFTEGHYRTEVFAQILGDRRPKRLFTQRLDISRDAAEQLRSPECGLYFDWGPDSLRYLPYVDKRPAPPNEDSLELLNLLRGSRSRSGR